MSEFTFDLEEMMTAVSSEVIAMPDGINDADDFCDWLDTL